MMGNRGLPGGWSGRSPVVCNVHLPGHIKAGELRLGGPLGNKDGLFQGLSTLCRMGEEEEIDKDGERSKDAEDPLAKRGWPREIRIKYHDDLQKKDSDPAESTPTLCRFRY
jgi:hypothetical protein